MYVFGLIRLDAFYAEEVVAKVALRMLLGIGAAVHNWNAEGTACVVVLETNPLADFVELPERYRALSYCQMLCGVIRGGAGGAS